MTISGHLCSVGATSERQWEFANLRKSCERGSSSGSPSVGNRVAGDGRLQNDWPELRGDIDGPGRTFIRQIFVSSCRIAAHLGDLRSNMAQ